MRTTLTQGEYQALVGWLAEADRLNQRLDEIAEAAQSLTGEEDDQGHTFDAVFDHGTAGEARPRADALLKRLGLTVAAAELRP